MTSTTHPPKYSVIIPTRNGGKYISHAINSVLSCLRDDVEVIVSNNYSTDDTSQQLSSYPPESITLVQPPEPLPMAAHYEFALRHAKGEWITILGDDDAVLPYIFDVLDTYISADSSIQAITSPRAYYFWDGCQDLYGENYVYYASLLFSLKLNSKLYLFLALLGLVSCFNLPQIYTCGIIRRDLYNRVLSNSNNLFFHSIIPDIYSSISILLSTESYLRIKTPLFWVGTSNKSMGRSTRIYSDTKDLSSINSSLPGNRCIFPSRISSHVSYEVHNQALSPYFLLEALSAFPNKELCGFFSSSTVYNLASASSLALSLFISKHSFFRNLKNLLAFYKSKSLPTLPLILFTPFCLLVLSLNKFYILICRLTMRLARLFKYTKYFTTKDRNLYPTLSDVNKLFIGSFPHL